MIYPTRKPKYNSKNSGQAMLIVVIFSLLLVLAILSGMVIPAVREARAVNELLNSKQSFFLAEAAVEDVAYRLKSGYAVSSPESLSLNSHTATVVIIDDIDEKVVVGTGDVVSAIRRVEARLNIGSGASFNFGVQTDNGGFIMENFSSVSGNIYSNGTITGTNNTIVRGDVVSAGPSGSVNGIHATGTVYARTITNATIEKDAYYQTLTNTSVGGTLHPGSPDQATSSLPITDEKVEEWKAAALAGGTITTPCPYKINSAVTIGPTKINCDLEISGNNYTITLAGPIWVSGNISINNSPTILVAESVGNKSVAIIADNESNRTTSSKITLAQGGTFQGNSYPNSYVLVLSQNNSAQNDGSEQAINVNNSVNGDLLLYAGHGEVRIDNSGELKQLTGWRIRLRNSAEIVYELGISSMLFSTGPGGSWNINDWLETE